MRLEKFFLSLIGFLFVVILIISTYVFVLSPDVPKKQQNTPLTVTPTPVVKMLISADSPQTFSNTSSNWLSKTIPNSKIKVLTPLQIDVAMSVSIATNAASNTSTGITFGNGLLEKDPNVRKINFYYYQKTKQWILKYQSGKLVKFYGVLPMDTKTISGNFSLLLAGNGKKITIISPDTSPKTIYFPDSLYAISNHMTLSVVLGPQTTIAISSLSYKK